MIHFKAEVEIRMVTWELLPILLNASMWSTRHSVPVEILSIDDSHHSLCLGNTVPYAIGLAADITVDSGVPADLESLYQYLRKTMPRDFDVLHERGHVHVQWDVRRPEMRRTNV